jgi:hypothetical protein
MTHPDISKWLNAERASFKTGVYLLNTFAEPSEQISKVFLKSDSSFSRKKLRAALTAIARRQNSEATPLKKSENRGDYHILGETQGYPKHLVELDRQIPLLNSEINSLANTTLSYPEGDSLKKVALKILELQREKSEMWKQLDYFKQHRTVMPGSDENEGDDSLVGQLVEWLDLQPAYLDYTRRYKKTKDPKRKREVERRMSELAKIKTFINNYGK